MSYKKPETEVTPCDAQTAGAWLSGLGLVAGAIAAIAFNVNNQNYLEALQSSSNLGFATYTAQKSLEHVTISLYGLYVAGVMFAIGMLLFAAGLVVTSNRQSTADLIRALKQPTRFTAEEAAEGMSHLAQAGRIIGEAEYVEGPGEPASREFDPNIGNIPKEEKES